MNSFLYYLLQVIVASAILYGYYYIALRNRKFHQYNRFYLLIATLISILIPFLHIEVYFSSEESQSSIVIKALTAISPGMENDVLQDAGVSAKGASHNLYTATLLYCTYILLSLVILYKIARSFMKIRALHKNNPVEKLGTIQFVRTSEPSTPFSFFRWMFWNKNIELNSDKGGQIFRHELFHIQQRHSIDILFMELLVAIFWINPFFHLIKKELKTIHEFLADSFVVNDTKQWEYAELLLMQVLQTNQHLVNPFFHNHIKRRIAMITNPQTTSHRYLRKLLVLPVAAIVVTLFAFRYKAAPSPEGEPAGLTSLAINMITDSVPVKNTVVETQGSLNKKIPQQPKLQAEGKNETKKSFFAGFSTLPDTSFKPLIIVDGVKMTTDDALYTINPEAIEYMTVYKGQQAVDLYGEAARNGAILIGTKQYTLRSDIPLETTRQDLQEIRVRGYRLDTISDKLTMAATFNGGQDGWRKYLERNLNSDIPINQKAPPGKYTVTVQFLVNTDGNVSDLKPLTKIGFGMEEEVIRIIKNGPKWIPASQDGRPVNSYKRQPVTFIVMGNDPDENAEALKEVVVVGFNTKPVSAQEPKVKTVAGKKLPADISHLSPIYPNPSTHAVIIPLDARETGKGEVRISDINGNVKMIIPASYVKGLNNLNVKVASLASGTYVIEVIDGHKHIMGTYKLLKQ